MAFKVAIDGVEHEWDANKLKFSEAEAIEGVYGTSYKQWNTDLAAGYMKAFHVMVWVLMRRDNPSLRFSEMGDMTEDQITLPQSEPEADPTEAASDSPPTD